MRTPRRHAVSVFGLALMLGFLGGSPAQARDGEAVAVVPELGTPAIVDFSLTFTGHGWGHGRGMGQYGALGYAVNYDWSAEQILDHFYQGTVPGDAGNPEIAVELSGLNGRELVAAGNNVLVNGTLIASGYSAVLARLQADGSVLLWRGPTCGGPWTPIAGGYTAGVGGAEALWIATNTWAGYENLIRVCESTGQRAYRGRLTVQNVGGSQYTFSRLSTQDYLRGVVPRESPDGWGTAGGGKGMQALRAQAVAARSYALSGSRPSGAKTCNTTSCQVYSGAAWIPNGGSLAVLDGPNANYAIDTTGGMVRRTGSAAGPIARTEFSSSTGGYTAGGTFPAVQDLGDAVTSNPNHNWSTVMASSTVAAALGVSGIRSIAVTGRNGLGADGGRVTQVTVVDAGGGTRTFSGNDVRTRLGLKSDWFTVSGSSLEAENVVRALYADVLGRAVDPDGLATWTAYIDRTRDPAGLARQIVASRERMENLVTAQYLLALNRTPERSGLDHWVAHLAAGRGVYDLQIGIYGSPESLLKLGGGDVQTWVGGLYERILGRTSDASERAYWATIAAQRGREAVVAAIARSDEATMRRLNVYYQTFLLRGVDPAGRATFLPLMTGRGDFDIPIALGSSPEYWARAQTRTY
jgi:SpoIID/LytB domain protein